VSRGDAARRREHAGLAGLAVAHELSNLLALAGTSAWLAGRTGDPAARARHLERVEHAVADAQGLLAALLAWSRGEPPRKRRVEAKDLLAAARAGVELGDAVEIEARIEPEGLTLFAEPILLGQALRNLVVNAVRATRGAGGGHVRISARVGLDGIELEVVDDGPGTTEGVAFGPDPKDPDGHGIGLPLARAIVEAQGGTLELAPSRRGARFVIALPVPRL
jgi:signal transduction histidine kinase